MRNIGIVRRLDELGRIVIPREFRKTHRINVGDPLEITATENGNIIISKVDQSSDFIKLCESACATLNSELKLTAAAASFERFVVAAGQGKQAINDKELNMLLMRLIKNRGFYNGRCHSDEIGWLDVGFEYVCVAPILSYDDCFGAIFVFSNSQINPAEAVSVKLSGKLVGSALQKY